MLSKRVAIFEERELDLMSKISFIANAFEGVTHQEMVKFFSEWSSPNNIIDGQRRGEILKTLAIVHQRAKELTNPKSWPGTGEHAQGFAKSYERVLQDIEKLYYAVLDGPKVDPLYRPRISMKV